MHFDEILGWGRFGDGEVGVECYGGLAGDGGRVVRDCGEGCIIEGSHCRGDEGLFIHGG